MSRVKLLAPVSMLLFAVGCVSVKTPDVSVDVMDPVNAYKRSGSSSNEPASAERVRYTPYAKTLERVNRQQVKVNEKFAKQDWKDLEEEADDWAVDVRDLNGYASSSHNPEKYRTLAGRLLDQVSDLKRAARAGDAAACRKALDQADATLAEFTKTFPLTEPVGSSSEPRPSRTNKVP